MSQMPILAPDGQFARFEMSDLSGIMDDLSITNREERWRVRTGLLDMQSTIIEWLSKKTSR